MGVDHGGLGRLRDRRFHVIGPAEGLSARTAASVCVDTNGVVWIGTAGGGLCRWVNGRISRFPVGARVSANFVFSVFPRADGGLWISAGEGEILHQFRDDQVQSATWEVHGVKCILTDPAGRIWMGTKAGPMLASSFFPPGFAALSRIGDDKFKSIAVSLTVPVSFLLGGGAST